MATSRGKKRSSDKLCKCYKADGNKPTPSINKYKGSKKRNYRQRYFNNARL